MSSNDTFDGAGGASEEYRAQGRTADSADTGTTYDAIGEPETTPHDEVLVTEDVDTSDPNTSSSGGLDGDMGLSSERTGPADETGVDSGIEGTGTTGSALHRTNGTLSTGGPHRDERTDTVDNTESTSGESLSTRGPEGAQGPEMDDRQNEATQEWMDSQPAVDRTVGESNTAEVPSQSVDRSKNPGHSHGG